MLDFIFSFRLYLTFNYYSQFCPLSEIGLDRRGFAYSRNFLDIKHKQNCIVPYAEIKLTTTTTTSEKLLTITIYTITFSNGNPAAAAAGMAGTGINCVADAIAASADSNDYIIVSFHFII